MRTYGTMRGTEIKALRKRLKISQGELAVLIGYSDFRVVCEWENDRRPVPKTTEILLRMLEAYPDLTLFELRRLAEIDLVHIAISAAAE